MSDWTPGDPLHQNPHVSHQSGFFTYRHDSELENCICPDRASWPEPYGSAGMRYGDELGDFITEWHAWNETEFERESA